MTSADDFHLISWRNFFGLAIIVVAVLIPVGLRFVWKKELQSVAQADAGIEEEGEGAMEVQGPLYGYVEEDEEEDVLLQTGPMVVNKGKQVAAVLGDGLGNDARLVLIQDDGMDESAEFTGDGDSSEEDDEVLAKR